MAIFMVVMGHVFTMCVRDIDKAPIFKFIGQIHMPLFFFISGWFTFKLIESSKVKKPNLGQRAMQLLIPMVFMSSLWIWYFPHSGLQSPLVSTFAGLWGESFKNGYWFTLVLYVIMVIYALFCPLFSLTKRIGPSILATLAVWSVLLGVRMMMPADLAGYLSFDLIVDFWPVFVFGAIAARHKDAFARVTSSGTWFTVCLLTGSALLYYLCWRWEFDNYFGNAADVVYSIAQSGFHICLAVVAIAVIKPWSDKLYSVENPTFGVGRRFADCWQLLGRRSLAIYLLHYFFLFPLGVCREGLLALNLSFVPLFGFAFVIAALIISVVLGVDAVISRSPILALLMTGQVAKRPKKTLSTVGA